jgi:AraC-like DNA-binding protein
MRSTVSAGRRARLNATAATLELGVRGARYEGPLLGVGRHASGVTCYVEARSGQVEVEGLRAKAVRIPAGVQHEVRAAAGARLVFWYLEPGGPPERTIRAAQADELGTLNVDVAEPPMDLRVRRALWLLEQTVELRPAELSARVGLSSSRLRHLVRDQLGVPLVRVRWWFQMKRAAQVLRAGHDLSHAAHHAGFSDSAHFSRTFRRMFGFAPSLLVGAMTGSRDVVAVPRVVGRQGEGAPSRNVSPA